MWQYLVLSFFLFLARQTAQKLSAHHPEIKQWNEIQYMSLAFILNETQGKHTRSLMHKHVHLAGLRARAQVTTHTDGVFSA